MVMPDAKVVAGLRVDASRNSLFGHDGARHMQVDDENFKEVHRGHGV